MLISISSVCASDVDDYNQTISVDVDTTTNSLNEGGGVNTNDYSLKTDKYSGDGNDLLESTNEEILNEPTSVSNYDELVSAISSSSEISVSNNITFSRQISINKDLIIDGKDHTFTGNKSTIFFSVTGGKVIFKNIYFIDGGNNNVGGALFLNGGIINISNCNFINNYASLRGGVAVIAAGTVSFDYCNFINNTGRVNAGVLWVYGSASKVNVSNCNFSYNSVISARDNDEGCGGAIRADVIGGDYSLNLMKCNFNYNTVPSSRRGGAILIKGMLNAEDCTFINNSAGSGGAIYSASSYSSVMNLVKCNFFNNSAYNGAAFCCDSGAWNLTNCNFTGNIVTGSGGAIYTTKGMIISNCDFKSNVANSMGGAIYTSNSMNISNCDFKSNVANSMGGAIHTSNSMNISNCEFLENRAVTLGSAISSTAPLIVTNSNFSSNNCSGNQYGGTIFSNNVNLSVIESTFVNNVAINSYGAAIYHMASNQVIIESSKFIGNRAKQGGALYISGSLNVNNCNFTNNSVSEFGGAIYTAGATTIGNTVFSLNKEKASISFSNDGVNFQVNLNPQSGVHYPRLLTKSSSSVSVQFNNVTYWNGTQFVNSNNVNPSTNGISGENITLKIYNKSDELIVKYSNFTNASGKIIINYIDYAQYIGLKFKINSTEDYYYYSLSKNDDVGNFTRLQNIINYYGSNCVINLTRDYTYSVGKDIITSGILISNNNVTINANGHTIDALGKSTIFNVQGSDVNLKSIVFKDGYSASVNGGAVNWCGSNGKLYNCSFYNNYAVNGAAVYWNGVKGKLYNCSFLNCVLSYSDYNKGVVYWNGVDGELYDCSFRNNSISDGYTTIALLFLNESNFILNNCDFISNNVGSVVVNRAYNVTVVGCNFTNNSKKHNGVCVYIVHSDVSIVDSNFDNNYHINSNSGIIYVDDCDNFSLSNSTFINNSAGSYGGVLFTTWTKNVSLSNCTFNDNKASSAGAVYLQGSGSVVGCNFTGNNASSDYGAVYLSGGKWIVDNCSFVNNTARYSAGAVQVSSGNHVISHSCFLDNYVTYDGGYGGAVYVYGNLNISDSYFMHNKEFAKLTVTSHDGVVLSVKLNTTNNVHYSRVLSKSSGAVVNFSNVSYWNGTSLVNSDSILPGSVGIVGENITLKIYSGDSLIESLSALSDENGSIDFNYFGVSQFSDLRFEIIHGVSDYVYGNLSVDDEVGDFTRLQSIVDYYGANSVINLTRNYTYTVGLDDAIVGGVVVSYGNVTVNANGFTIDAVNKSRIFNITADNVVLSNITFVNGNGSDGGAIIWMGVNGSVLNSNFVNNSGVNGGAIYSDCLLNISNAEFYNNIASNGGAIYSVNQLNIFITSFYNNTAYSGSAVYTNNVVNMSSVVFIDNLANVSSISIKFNQEGRNVTVNFTLKVCDNFVNAIYSTGTIYYSNITYFEDDKVKVSDDTSRVASNSYESDDVPFIHEGAFGENLTVTILKGNDPIFEYNLTSNYMGSVSLELYRLLLGDTNYNFSVVYNKNNYYGYYEVNDTLYVYKADPQLIISSSFIDKGDVANVTISVLDDVHGGLVIKVNDTVNVTLSDVYGVSSVSFENVNTGLYQVVAVYSGDENYTGVTQSCTLFVDRPATKLNIDVDDIYVGGVALFNFTLKSFLTDEFLDNASGIVRVIVGGKQYNVTIVGGKGNLSVSNLSIGEYEVIAIYGGDLNYKGCDGGVSFEVKGYETNLNIEINPSLVRVGDSFNVIVKVNSTINNEPIYLYVNGELYGIALTVGGVVNFTVSDLKAGEHDINASFNDNGFFASTCNDTVVDVLKHESGIVAEAVCDENNNVSIIIKLPGDAVGNLTVLCNDSSQLITTPVSDLVVIGVKDPNAYSFNVTYLGDDKYFASSVNATVNVGKISNYNMTLNTTAIVSGRDTCVFVMLPDSFEGLVNFTINGVSYDNKEVVGGVAVVEVNVNKSWSSINVTAFYSGFGKYDGKSVSGVFLVVPTDDYEIIIGVGDSFVGDDVVVNITAPDEISNVTITIEKISDNVNFVNGQGNYTIFDVHEGEYFVSVYYAGDDTYYVAKSFNKTFNVYRKAPVFNITVSNITFGDNETINVNIDDVATGFLVITVDNVDYYLNLSETHNLSVRNLNSGHYGVNASYMGDVKFNSSFYNTSFEVFKYTPVINVSVCDVVYGEDVVVNVTSDVSGKYNVSVGSLTRDVILNAGVNVLVVFAGLDANLDGYVVNVTYSEGDNYNVSVNDTQIVKVLKAGSNVSIDPISNVVYLSNVEVAYTIENRTSLVVIVCNKESGEEIIIPDLNITGNKVIIGGLATGNYSIIINNTGSENYNASFGCGEFSVFRYTPVICVSVEDVIYNATVVVRVNVDVGGIYTIKVGEYENATSIVANSLAEIKFANLNANVDGYQVNVTYEGNANYTAVYNDTQFVKVIKADSSVEITGVVNGTYKTTNATITVSYTNGTDITFNITGVKSGKLEDLNNALAGLGAGEYTIIINNAGDENHTASNVTAVFSVAQANSGVEITEPVNVTYNDDVVIEFNVVNKTSISVTITKDGENITGFTINDNNVTIPSLSVGVYNITIVNGENDNYTQSNATATFEVYMADSSVNITEIVNGTYKTTNATITVSYTNGTDITFNITGVASGNLEDLNNTLAGLAAGNYTIIINNAGDENHKASNTTANFSVAKAGSKVIIKDFENVTYPDNLVIGYEIENKTSITISITGVEDGFTYTDNNITISDLKSGNYTITITNNANENYTQSSASANFTISKYTPSINVSVENVVYNASVVVTVTTDVTGLYTIKVGEYENTTTIDANTPTEVKFNNLNANESGYKVNVTYTESENYTSAYNDTQMVKVFKAASSVEIVEIENGTYKTVDTSVGIKFTNGTIKFNITKDGVEVASGSFDDIETAFAGLNASEYTIIFTNIGDANHNASTTSGIFTVYRANSSINIDEVVNVTYGANTTVKFNVVNETTVFWSIYNETGYIVASGEDSSDNISIKLAAGNYTIKIHNSESDNYESAFASANFIVFKAGSNITVGEFTNVTYGNDLEINFTVVNQTGISATVYNLEQESVYDLEMRDFTDNGIIIHGLDAGDYYVRIINDDGENITGSFADVYFTILKATPQITVTPVNVTYPGNVIISVKSDVSGNYLVRVGSLTQDLILTANETKNATFGGLNAGNYSVNVNCVANVNYEAASSIANVSVYKINSLVEITPINNVTYPNAIEIIFNVENATTTTITVLDANKNSVDYSINKDGKIIVQAKPGSYTINIANAETVNVNSANATANFTINSVSEYNLNASSENVTTKQNATIIVTLPVEANGKVIVKVNGTEYNATAENGKAVITINKLAEGSYEANIIYVGDSIYGASNATVNVTVKKVDDYSMNASSTSPVYGEDAVVTVNLSSDATGNVTVKSGDKTFNSTVSGGKATVKVSDLAFGDNPVSVTYDGDGNYTSKSIDLNIHVSGSVIVANPMSSGVGSGMDYQARLVNEYGAPAVGVTLKFTINGVDYEAVTDANGYASINANLAVGTYAVSILEPLSGISATSQVTIVSRIIDNKDLSMSYLEGKAYTVRIIGDDANPVGAGVAVSFNMAGKTYNVVTDANGYAKVSGFSNAPGTYTISASYHSQSVSNKVAISTLFISKKNVKIKKAKINKKGYLGISYKVGKYLKGKKISLKFKGKTYKAKVNNKGKVQLKIPKKVVNKLKVGKKYKYTLIYKFDKKNRYIKVYKKYLLFSSK